MWEPQGIYSKYLLKQPTILFGPNGLLGLKTYPSSRVAVIHGSSMSKEVGERIKNAVSSFSIKFIRKTWNGEPDIDSLNLAIEQVSTFNPNLIIAVGGGSVIDGAKMIRTYFEFPFFDFNGTNLASLEWKTNFVVIPTTIGSGAEISSASVLYNKNRGTKEFVVSHQFIPDVIVFDSELIGNAPRKLMLSTIVDAMSHCIEGYLSTVDNVLVDCYAEKSIQIFSKYAHVLDNPTDYEGISKLQLAATFAGIVQNHCIVGATHAIAHQLSSYGFSHSSAIALFLPTVIRTNIKREETFIRFTELAENSGFRDAESLLLFIEEFIRNIDLDKENILLKENKNAILSNDDFFKNAINDKGGRGNPIALDDTFLKGIFNKVVS